MVSLPKWLTELRETQIVDRIRNDKRSIRDTILGISFQSASDVIQRGQTDFTKPHANFSTEDLALIYAYCNQRRHLEELIAAFGQIFAKTRPKNPIVVDLGCGPFTGGLALAAAIGKKTSFKYIGIDRAECMRNLGEQLAATAQLPNKITRHWSETITGVNWMQPPSWDEIIVIISYLFASPTLDARKLFSDLKTLLERLGTGRVLLLYTNVTQNNKNEQFNIFQEDLQKSDFKCLAFKDGKVWADRSGETKCHDLKYALFVRPPQNQLKLAT